MVNENLTKRVLKGTAKWVGGTLLAGITGFFVCGAFATAGDDPSNDIITGITSFNENWRIAVYASYSFMGTYLAVQSYVTYKKYAERKRNKPVEQR